MKLLLNIFAWIIIVSFSLFILFLGSGALVLILAGLIGVVSTWSWMNTYVLLGIMVISGLVTWAGHKLGLGD